MPLMVNYNIYNLGDSVQELVVAGRKIFLWLAYLREPPAVTEKITYSTIHLCLSVFKIGGPLFTKGSLRLPRLLFGRRHPRL